MWLAADLEQRSPLRIVLNDETGDIVFSESASTALFRIVQESLTNVVRHAPTATEVRIDFRCNASMCDLSTEDDGVSAEPQRPQRRSAGAPPSSGLAGIRVASASGCRSASILDPCDKHFSRAVTNNLAGEGFRLARRQPISTDIQG